MVTERERFAPLSYYAPGALTRSVVLGEQAIDSRMKGSQIQLGAVPLPKVRGWFARRIHLTFLGSPRSTQPLAQTPFFLVDPKVRGRFVRARGRYISQTHVGLSPRSTQTMLFNTFCFFLQMHELLVSRGFVRRPTPLNSSDEDGGVFDQTSKAERPRVDAATAERKLKNPQASAKLESTGDHRKRQYSLAIDLFVIRLFFFLCVLCFSVSGDNTVFASRSRIMTDPSRCDLAADTRTQHHLLQYKVICIRGSLAVLG